MVQQVQPVGPKGSCCSCCSVQKARSAGLIWWWDNLVLRLMQRETPSNRRSPQRRDKFPQFLYQRAPPPARGGRDRPLQAHKYSISSTYCYSNKCNCWQRRPRRPRAWCYFIGSHKMPEIPEHCKYLGNTCTDRTWPTRPKGGRDEGLQSMNKSQIYCNSIRAR